MNANKRDLGKYCISPNLILKDNLSLEGIREKCTQEAYFGAETEFKQQLIFYVSRLREKMKSSYKEDNNRRALVIARHAEQEKIDLENFLRENTNVEKCIIGFRNDTNISTIGYSILNNDMYNDKTLRVKLADITEYKGKTYRFKNSKGIFFILEIGMVLLLSEDLTDAELAAGICHEIGHLFSAVSMSINERISYDIWFYFLRIAGYEGPLSKETQEKMHYDKIKTFLKMYEQEEKNGLENINKLGEKIFEEDLPRNVFQRNTITPSKINSNKITQINNQKHDMNDNVKIRLSFFKIRPSMSKWSFPMLLINLLTLPITILFNLFIIPFSIFRSKEKNKIEKYSKFKREELIADNIAVIYGFGPELASLLKKLEFISKGTYKYGVGSYVPSSIRTIFSDNWKLSYEKTAIMTGYPPKKERILSLYSSLKSELKNNKDLPDAVKKDIERQANDILNIYEDLVDKTSPNGLLYEIFSSAGRRALKNAMKDNKELEKTVLGPLRDRYEKGEIEVIK